jgi:uncharacterized PurR-regulated membrane protein YhhQ (DUF165 family)
VGQAIDSVLFMGIAFAGVLPPRALLGGILSIYVVKVAIEAAALPASTRFADWLKRIEHCDQLDNPERVSYNPFRLRLSGPA